MNIKGIIRTLLNKLHLDLTKNLEYDRLSQSIMKRYLHPNSNCLDIGCHKGEILDIILKLSPNGNHVGFEPIPDLYTQLKLKFGTRADILPYALSDSEGTSSFQYVKNAPAYSGLRKRHYDINNPVIQEIEVEIKRLDDIIAQQIDFIKIDVEGGEFGVLNGAENLLRKNKPLIIFEFGKGASEYYQTKPVDIYNFITVKIGLKISTLKSFLKKTSPLTLAAFVKTFEENTDYYFVAFNADDSRFQK